MNARVDGIDVQMVEAPAFTYSLYDLLDPSKVKGNKSTTIKIIPTNAARQVLGSEVMAEEAERTHELRIGEQGATYWRGEVKVDRWTRDEIECSSVSGNASWMEAAKNKDLRSIEMGSSEEITAAYQRDTWTDETTPIHFPIIGYGYIAGRAQGFNVATKYLRPAARAWAFIERGFAELGWVIEAKGLFGNLARKLILPNVSDNIAADERTRREYTAIAETNNAQTFTTTTGPTGQDTFEPTLDVEVSDPSGSYNPATNVYTIGLDNITIRPKLTGYIEQFSASSQFSTLRFLVTSSGGAQVYSFTTVQPTTQTAGPVIYDLADFELPSVGAVSGQTFEIRIQTVDGVPGNSILLNNLTVTWEPTFIPYQEGVTIDVNTTVPDWTLAELLKEVSTVLNLKLVTNDDTGKIEAWHYTDLLKPISQGVDWRGKESHNDAPEKVTQNIPSQYRFRYADDDTDAFLINVQSETGAPGYGNYDADTDGFDEPLDIETKFAATVMGNELGSIFIPLMPLEGGTYQVDNYKRKSPRLLIADGTVFGEWTHNGDALEYYPKAYFVWPGETRWSLSFGNETRYGTTAAGTAETYYREYIRRAGAYMLHIDVRLWDDELIGLDLTRPVYVSDGYHDGWYYIGEVEQKRFGVPEYTRVKLMQQ